MKLQKHKVLFGGLTATMAAILTLGATVYGIAKSPLAVDMVDDFFGVNREIWEERTVEGVVDFTKKHDNVKDFADALVEQAKEQGRQGFALLKNDNKALPLASNAKVALFGWNCYNSVNGHTGFRNNNASSYAPNITLYSAFKAMQGVTVNDTIVSGDFTGKMAKASANYTVPEKFEAKDSWTIDKTSEIGIVAVGRGGGENGYYLPDQGKSLDGTAQDPLALSKDELAMIDYAKAHCSKVVVLVITSSAMEIGPIIKGGEHEVDAIGYCGTPNSYQYGGIVDVLMGKTNATGGLNDTFVFDNSFTPAVINMGQQTYEDVDVINMTAAEDPYKRGKDFTAAGLSANKYVVGAEGIYVGYKYYETRYYDAMVDAVGTNATDKIGSTTGAAWDYSKEVVYTFGHGLSYYDYEQEVTGVTVDVSENGNVVAKVKVTNKTGTPADFTTQLYVQRPYTDYDKTNLVEKSAVDFLNSARVSLGANESKTVDITVPTRYLASWDSKGAKTYILDEGDYYFTAAAGAHEAVNNILKQQKKTTDGKEGTGKAATWNQGSRDTKTFAVSNGAVVTNQFDNADINYYLPGKVTYMTRQDWKTYPKNYTELVTDANIASEAKFKIGDSAKKDEWLKELRNVQYEIKTNDPVKNIEGIVPDEVKNGTYASVWEWIVSFKMRNPEAFNDIDSDIWNQFAAAINMNEAIAKVDCGGSDTDMLVSLGNPTSVQSESCLGYSQTLTIIPESSEGAKDSKTMGLNVGSNTLIACSFNPELAYQWGLTEGECGLWLQDQKKQGAITVWGGGLNIHRTAYNGRNSEYMSEDPMLTNRMGAAQYKGAMEKGSINGPKHMGFNDQEYNRVGNAEYMTEQKVRETDIRCYEGALRGNESNANGVMMSFSRIGATNVTNSAALMYNVMRKEWAFTGITTTDMGRVDYHTLPNLINATCTQLASMRTPDSYMGKDATDFSDEAACKKCTYITIGSVKNDNWLVERARENCKYEFYTIAHSATYNLRAAKDGEKGEQFTMNVLTGHVSIAGWEGIFIALIVVFGLATAAAAAAWIAANVLPEKEDK